MLRWLEDTGEVSVFRSPSNYSNGNFRDRQGRLLTCEHDSRRLTRTEHDGAVTVLMGFQGKPLNAPNDLVVHSDGAIWFDKLGTRSGRTANDRTTEHGAMESPSSVLRLRVERTPGQRSKPAVHRLATLSHTVTPLPPSDSSICAAFWHEVLSTTRAAM